MYDSPEPVDSCRNFATEREDELDFHLMVCSNLIFFHCIACFGTTGYDPGCLLSPLAWPTRCVSISSCLHQFLFVLGQNKWRNSLQQLATGCDRLQRARPIVADQMGATYVRENLGCILAQLAKYYSYAHGVRAPVPSFKFHLWSPASFHTPEDSRALERTEIQLMIRTRCRRESSRVSSVIQLRNMSA